MLVHGGGHGAWCWQPLLRELEAEASAVDLPPVSIRGGAGRNHAPPGTEELHLADWADAVIAGADAAGFDRFVLVGHSLGGLTVCEVARRMPARVAHVVLVSALVPEEGTTAVDAMPKDDRLAAGLTDDVVREMFCSDMDDEQTRFVLDHVGTDVAQIMTEPVTRAGLPASLPVTYVRLGLDQALSPDTQDACIERLREIAEVAVVRLDAGHDVMISRPKQLALVLDEIAG